MTTPGRRAIAVEVPIRDGYDVLDGICGARTATTGSVTWGEDTFDVEVWPTR